ncbi:hypothetical protein N658DRAFT_197921 [Parathielavia hyrcaniae]|uniref:Uncharacterized protein n=1 Tax=Parathielavia hyrcaniae TaxID=113614 RepID=A0AAN6T4M3_9PEZI|nr:hypothetical protein N658DRAFT_197921 [Parathielavia hyrcaniae]
MKRVTAWKLSTHPEPWNSNRSLLLINDNPTSHASIASVHHQRTAPHRTRAQRPQFNLRNEPDRHAPQWPPADHQFAPSTGSWLRAWARQCGSGSSTGRRKTALFSSAGSTLGITRRENKEDRGGGALQKACTYSAIHAFPRSARKKGRCPSQPALKYQPARRFDITKHRILLSSANMDIEWALLIEILANGEEDTGQPQRHPGCELNGLGEGCEKPKQLLTSLSTC